MVRVRVLDLDLQGLKNEFQKIAVDRSAINIMLPKGKFYLLKIEGLSSVNANIIKQQMLASGGEAAVARGAITGKVKYSDCIIMGTSAQFNHLIHKLTLQPWFLKETADKIREVLLRFNQPESQIVWDNYKLEFGRKTLIMGIVNVTPDSFSNGGKFFNLDSAVAGAQRLEEEGADIIDIGGESTRPGAKAVKLAEELRRVIPVIKKVRKKIKVPISIDTRKSKVAQEAIEFGANIINDISGLKHDPNMIKVIKRYKTPLILMHIKGNPRTMQINPHYEDVISEIYTYFEKSILRLTKYGVEEGKIIIDPGIGFGKNLDHNIQILKRLKEFKSLGRPILIGTSRKSFIGAILNLPVDKRLNGTLASCACAIINGADILRVHDVRQVSEVIKIVDCIIR